MGKIKDEIVAELPAACSDEAVAVEFIERQRWGDEPYCPRCDSRRVYRMKDRKTGARSKRFLWFCTICERQFTVRIGTVLEDSRIPLRHWCYAFWAACASKKGVSALQIKRMTGLSYKSALFMMHRIRFAMAEDPIASDKLDGTLEVDEAFIGGKPRNKGPHNKRGSGADKQPIVALVQRNGKARAQVVDKVNAANIRRFVLRHASLDATLMTDEAGHYVRPGRSFRGGHWTVHHGRREYVRGFATTNTVEGFFALVKRGIYGTFHSVSRHHLHRYLSEFVFRYNARQMSDGERTALAIRSTRGKRLRYRAPVEP